MCTGFRAHRKIPGGHPGNRAKVEQEPLGERPEGSRKGSTGPEDDWEDTEELLITGAEAFRGLTMEEAFWKQKTGQKAKP